MSKIKKVITINNEELPVDQCRNFQGNYYKIGDINVIDSGDCYQIGEKYYRFETGQIVFDYEVKQYVLKNDKLTHGIIGFENNELQLGYFTVIGNKNIEVKTPQGLLYGLNADIFNNTKLYRERLSDGKFYHISKLPASNFNILVIPPQEYKTSLPYDSKHSLDVAIDRYSKLDIEITNSNIDEYAKYLKDYTFGLEFETTKGLIPNRLLNESSLIPLRDGSISGIEYVTVPLQGAKGLQSIVNDTKLLKERTDFNDSCSMHLHIAGIPRTKEYILALFKTICFIQDEIFQMFPLYKKYNFGIKNKNYSAPFPSVKLLSAMDNKITDKNINENFDILYRFLACGYNTFNEYNNDLDNIINHPADPEGNQKWNVNSRYTIINLIPIVFGNKKTIEFRIHTPTVDCNKIIPFIFLNTTILDFVKKYERNILNNSTFLNGYNLVEIIYNTCENSTIADYLVNYIQIRKSQMEYYNKNSDMMVDESKIPNPSKIKWNINNKKKNNIEPKIEFIDSQIKKKIDQAINQFDTSWIDSLNLYDYPGLGITKSSVQPIKNNKIKIIQKNRYHGS